MPKIAEQEKLSRSLANDSVFGTFAMEGLEPDEATREIFHQYANGDLTLEQFSEAMDRHAQDLIAIQSKMAGAA